jgi:hypothetical protein
MERKRMIWALSGAGERNRSDSPRLAGRKARHLAQSRGCVKCGACLATEYRMEEHLRACGCDWLRQVAVEERLSGRIFTPEEIVQRRPEVVTPPSPPKAVAQRPTDPAVLPKIRAAIAAQDFEEIEGLRDVLNDEITRQIASEWRAELPWEVKDAYAALLLDQTADCVRPLFQDALHSPTLESRAYAVCVLTQDFGRFKSMLVNGGLDEAKVAEEVATLSSPRP